MLAASAWLAPTAAPAAPAAEAEGPASWATRRAAALTADARRLREMGEPAEALVRLRDALSMDPTHEPAYLELAAAREATGDLREAEQVLSMALERIPGSTEARARRASLRARRGDRVGAARDLDAALEARPLDLALHAQVTASWIGSGQLPRALAAARRWSAAAEHVGDAASAATARRTAAACAWIVDRADPVTWAEDGDGVRRLLARTAPGALPHLHRSSTSPPRTVR